jgi:2-polyprenyl-3-methyl-5-hydroxy-6-metoxy-1,4-benzoquinol methylase
MLNSRVLDAELMDQPGLDVRVHEQALQGLRRVNSWSRTADVIWQAIRLTARRHRLTSLRVLDLASGGGDVCRQLMRRAQRDELQVTVHGWDRSETAVAHARRQADAEGLRGWEFTQRDALTDRIEDSYDVVMSTLFLHHLAEEQAVSLLRRMATAARHSVLIDDLLRSRWGLVLAVCGCRLLTRSRVVHVDGPMSVRAAFCAHEVRALASRAGLSRFTLRRHWPQRFLLTWSRP